MNTNAMESGKKRFYKALKQILKNNPNIDPNINYKQEYDCKKPFTIVCKIHGKVTKQCRSFVKSKMGPFLSSRMSPLFAMKYRVKNTNFLCKIIQGNKIKGTVC